MRTNPMKNRRIRLRLLPPVACAPPGPGTVRVKVLPTRRRRRWIGAYTNRDSVPVSDRPGSALHDARWRESIRRAYLDADGSLSGDPLRPVRWVRVRVADEGGDGKASFVDIDGGFRATPSI
jgi:hypothetical protein